MPQFDFSQALPQILWLLLVFAVIYVMVSAMLPKVQRVVEDRRGRIAADLGSAEAARAAAEAAVSGGGTALADARGEALGVTNRARDAAAAATARRLAETDETLKLQAEAAAASLATTRASALAELEQVAVDATVDLVARVSGLRISADEAADAVRKAA